MNEDKAYSINYIVDRISKLEQSVKDLQSVILNHNLEISCLKIRKTIKTFNDDERREYFRNAQKRHRLKKEKQNV